MPTIDRSSKNDLKRAWISANFESTPEFYKRIFELRSEIPRDISRILKLPSSLWNPRSIRKLRQIAIKYMICLKLQKDPNVTSEKLWDEWELDGIPKWEKYGRDARIRGFDDLFKEAKKIRAPLYQEIC